LLWRRVSNSAKRLPGSYSKKKKIARVVKRSPSTIVTAPVDEANTRLPRTLSCRMLLANPDLQALPPRAQRDFTLVRVINKERFILMLFCLCWAMTTPVPSHRLDLRLLCLRVMPSPVFVLFISISVYCTCVSWPTSPSFSAAHTSILFCPLLALNTFNRKFCKGVALTLTCP
jgi:hypothetical protein